MNPVKGKKSTTPAENPRLTGFSAFVVHCLLLVLLTTVVYWNSVYSDFVFDDQQIVMQNPQILNIHSIGDIARAAMGWRQLLFFSYGLNYYWSGVDAKGYHVVNIVLHAINVILVYFIIYEVAGRYHDDGRYAALAGAAVFSVHTLLSSAVSYIAGRSSVLCAIFYFTAVLLFLKALNDEELPSRRAVYVVLAAFAGFFGWQAKQEVLTLPGVLAALLWLRSEKKDLRYVAALAALPLVIAATMWSQLKPLFATVMGNKVLVAAGFDAVLEPATYFRTYITSIVWYYIPRFAFPAALNADPHIEAALHWYSPLFVIAVAVIAFLIWLVVRKKSSDGLLTAGLAAILLSPLTAYALIPLADVVLEHRAYIPGLGIGLLAASLFRWLSRQYPAARTLAPLACVVVLGVMTIQRNPVFANNVKLWEDAVQKSPKKARAVFNLGAAYQNAGRPGDAIRQYQAALALKPDIHAAYSNMSAIQLDSGQLDEGEKTLVRLTEIAPEYTEGFINLSVLYLRKQQTDKALTAADRAIAINQESFAAHFNKAEALTQKGDFVKALESYKESVHLRPDLEKFRLNLGVAYFRAGQKAEAEQQFRSLLNGPFAAEAWRDLASMCSDSETDKAIGFLNSAIQAQADYTDAHHDLAILFLKKELFDKAIDEFQKTLTYKPDFAPAALNLSLTYQRKNDMAGARQALESFLSRNPDSKSPYVSQMRERLQLLKRS